MLGSRLTARWLLFVTALLIGCGGSSPTDEDDETGHPHAAMVGLWIFQSATENGNSIPLADALAWLPATVQARLNVEANGGYQYEEVDQAGGQVWIEYGFAFVDQEGGTIELNVQGDSDGPASDEVLLNYTLGAGVLSLETLEGGSTVVFTLTS